MSQIVTIKAQIKDFDILKRTLDELGCPGRMEMWYSKITGQPVSEKFTFSLRSESPVVCCTDAFVEQKGEFYEINYVADGMAGYLSQSMSNAVDKIIQKYTYLKLKDECEKRHLTIAEEKILEDDTIKIVIREY
ncbi:MAG TPA: hypothetical protein PLB98_02135 [bacterium]|nr:hypothetical protein [bacterium]